VADKNCQIDEVTPWCDIFIFCDRCGDLHPMGIFLELKDGPADTKKQLWEMNLVTWEETNMAGLKGKSGPPGNMNAFKHGLAAIQKRREESITTEHEENVRQQILDGLIADKGGDEQISTATRILAEHRQ
jgi:hypothetical protein